MAESVLSSGLPARLFAIVRDEDLGEPGGRGDVSSQVSIHPSSVLIAVIAARQSATVSGLAFAQALADAVAPGVVVEPLIPDGQCAQAGTPIARLRGPAQAVLAVERPLLNLLGRLSGVATLTSAAVDRVRGTQAVICDTRKTTPGLRVLEKYAVVCGGGTSHRMGLHDAVMLKDNHLAAMRQEGESLRDAIQRAATQARQQWGDQLAFVQIECDTLEQFQAVLDVPPGLVDLVLLDNMPPDTLRQAVAMRGDRPIGLEASGGITIDTLSQVAATGIDRISLGQLTTRATGIDFGLDHEHTITVRTPEPPLEQWGDALEAVDTHGLVGRVVVIKQTASTQDLARSMASSDHGVLVIAGHQTAGRGRLGRTWHDTPGHSLAMTLALPVPPVRTVPPEKQVNQPAHSDLLGLIAGLALCTVAHRFTPALITPDDPERPWSNIALRWPNDAVHVASGRKLAGVLVESSPVCVLIGMGMNVTQITGNADGNWHPSLAGKVTSMAELGASCSRLELACELLKVFAELLRLERTELLEIAAKANALRGRRRVFLHDNNRYQGRVGSIDHQGAVELTLDDGSTVHLPAATTSLVHDDHS
jgi:nicotinate-nucleotide pyrophosphorylase (carboxylating)